MPLQTPSPPCRVASRVGLAVPLRGSGARPGRSRAAPALPAPTATHRPGEAALYMSPRAEWAIAAVSGYMREDGHARVLLPLRIGEAYVLDQHDEEACRSLSLDRERSNEPWRAALAAGREPASWSASDAGRRVGADGLIDSPRKLPGGWHLTLFRWNALGGSLVEVAGEAQPIPLSPDGPKWGL